MRLRVPDTSMASPQVHDGAQKGPSHRPRPAHLAGTGEYARRDSLAQIPCFSARSKCLILQGRFAQFALLGMRCMWAASRVVH